MTSVPRRARRGRTAVPPDDRVLAALGPKMLELARDRAAGAHPYLVTPEHTAVAREAAGPDGSCCPSRRRARDRPGRGPGDRPVHLADYLGLPNYANNWKRFGFTDDDIADGGSDRLVDALVAWGDEDAIAARVQEHRDAGADHVCIQVLTDEPLRSPQRVPPSRSGPLRLTSMPQDPSNVPEIDDWNRLLDGRVAVVTGGGDGIGGAISRLFAAHGAVVEIAEVDRERAERAVDEIDGSRRGGPGPRGRCHRPRRRRPVGRRRVGGAPAVDVVVNNVGDYRPLAAFRKSSPESWRAMYDVNFLHVVAVTHAFLESMIAGGGGAIVNVHSVEGMRGYPPEPIYGAMKAAVAAFTTNLAVSMGRHGIRVNGIGPDLTQTPQVDYLAGSEGTDGTGSRGPRSAVSAGPRTRPGRRCSWRRTWPSFVTGHNIPVDGGTLAGGGWFWSPAERRFVNRSRHL